MVKHWYRHPKTKKFMCDIFKSRCKLESKYCINCDVYKNWKSN